MKWWTVDSRPFSGSGSVHRGCCLWITQDKEVIETLDGVTEKTDLKADFSFIKKVECFNEWKGIMKGIYFN